MTKEKAIAVIFTTALKLLSDEELNRLVKEKGWDKPIGELPEMFVKMMANDIKKTRATNIIEFANIFINALEEAE